MRFPMQHQKRSAVYARNRIRLLVQAQRMECSEQMMTQLQKDLTCTLKKYLSVEDSEITISISQEPVILHIRIPVRQKKDLNNI